MPAWPRPTYIHPRFTHYERSYDYSDYPRAVNNYQPGVPADTDYIVIDTHGPLQQDRAARIRCPNTATTPTSGNCSPDNTDGYFIVLKRKHPGSADPQQSDLCSFCIFRLAT